MHEAFAAYREDMDWIPLSSISINPDIVEQWINKTYVSGYARSLCKVVKIRIRVTKD